MKKRTTQRLSDLAHVSKKQPTLVGLDRNTKRRMQTLIRRGLILNEGHLFLTEAGLQVLSFQQLTNISLSSLPQGEYIAEKICSGKRYYVGRRNHAASKK